MACASLLLGMRRHLQQHEVARMIQMLEDGPTQRDVTPAFGVTQSAVSRWSRYLATGGCVRPRTPTMQDRSPRPLHPPNGCTSPSQYCTSTLDGLPASLKTVNQGPKLCAIDSMRSAFTADDQHVAPFSPGNTVELDLTLLRIINIGSCITGVPFSSQTSPDSMSLLVTDVGGYGGGPVNSMLTATSSNTTDMMVGP